MSDQIKHECGIALIRLLKPLEYYKEKYGTWSYGLHKLYLLMEKQHNRGQDGAGVVSIKLDHNPGKHYINRLRSNNVNPIKDVFGKISEKYSEAEKTEPKLFKDSNWAKDNVPFVGELYLGHLRYGTFGNQSLDYVQPIMRENNWRSRNLVMAGNFNLSNVDELFKYLIELGQQPNDVSDSGTVLEKVGHYLDEENQLLFRKFKNEGFTNKEISALIEKDLNITKIIEQASKNWDGGYAFSGVIGHGDAFITRDPWGIRPAYWYKNDEIFVVTSERPVIQTVLNVPMEDIKEVKPGYAVVIKKSGEISEVPVRVPQEKKSCSFERIYFSRGSDADIYHERKKLGELLIPKILKSIDYDIENTVFSYIPNTAESSFFGMMEGLKNGLIEIKKTKIKELGDKINEEELCKIISMEPRMEKIAIKDAKLRTFITSDDARNDLVEHVYDITYGVINPKKDTLVIIDDSIVRGTTLKRSILKILDRLQPKKIIVVSSAPQIRYPDCYGIDMAKLKDFIAFEAAINLLKERGKQSIIDSVYDKCKAQQNLPKEEIVNYVTELYKPFTDDEISAKISELLKPIDINADVEIIYQTVDNLHKACPNDLGDWYFTGNYPTPGGNRVVNNSFINYMEGSNARGY